MSRAMRCDCVSVPIRGSRFAGMVSMTNVTVEGSRDSWRTQAAHRARRKTATHVVKMELYRSARMPARRTPPLVWRGIADLPEDRGTAGARCVGQVRGAPVIGFMRKDGECKCFFGIFRNAQCRRRDNINAGEPSGNLRHH